MFTLFTKFSVSLHSSRRMSSRVVSWKGRWDLGYTGFHKTEINPMLSKHIDKLISGSRINQVFFPLCGKSVDMKWLADKGYKVTGVEGVETALEQFFKEQEVESVIENVPSLGEKAKLFRSKDGAIRLYCCDIMNFTSDLDGTADVIWDRAALVALDREDVPQYVKVIKNILSPGGRMLLETMEYDLSIMDDVDSPKKPPPPYPMFEAEIKKLYEPECSVEFLDRTGRELSGKDIHIAVYLIVKKP